MPRCSRAAVLSSVVLLAGLTACGAPSDAPKKDFCKAATAGNDSGALYDAIEAEDWKKAEGIYHDQADDLDEVGTPDGISDKAREGFEVNVKALGDVSADEVEKAVADGKDVVRDDVKGDDLEKLEAFQKYVIATCTSTNE